MAASLFFHRFLTTSVHARSSSKRSFLLFQRHHHHHNNNNKSDVQTQGIDREYQSECLARDWREANVLHVNNAFLLINRRSCVESNRVQSKSIPIDHPQIGISNPNWQTVGAARSSSVNYHCCRRRLRREEFRHADVSAASVCLTNNERGKKCPLLSPCRIEEEKCPPSEVVALPYNQNNSSTHYVDCFHQAISGSEASERVGSDVCVCAGRRIRVLS